VYFDQSRSIFLILDPLKGSQIMKIIIHEPKAKTNKEPKAKTQKEPKAITQKEPKAIKNPRAEGD